MSKLSDELNKSNIMDPHELSLRMKTSQIHLRDSAPVIKAIGISLNNFFEKLKKLREE